MRTMTFLSAALLLAACSGDAGKEEDDCGVELASIYPEDGATGVPVDDLVVLVELSPSDAFGDVDVLDPDGVSVWGNIGKSPIEVEFLFGDILAISRGDLGVIWGGAAVVLALTLWRWSPLLTATLNPDLARASGIDPRREQFGLTLALALVVAVAIKVVGILLITALLVIPAAAARPLVRTPEAMALVAASIGAISALGGLWAAYHFDTPTGPSIVCVTAVIFAATTLTGALRRRR